MGRFFSRAKYNVSGKQPQRCMTRMDHFSYQSGLYLVQNAKSPDGIEAEIVIKMMGRVRTVHTKMVIDLKLRQKLQKQEVEDLQRDIERDEVRRNIRMFCEGQKKWIEDIVTKYAEEILRLGIDDPARVKEVQRKMLDEII